MATFHFHDLDRAIDEVHVLFDAWAEGGDFSQALDAEGLDVLRLAVHEWVANLVQHARFEGTPSIELTVEAEPDVVHCSITDSSCGFDFASQIETQRAVLEAPAPSERGRGLLMLVTCTEALLFVPMQDGHLQHIAFDVRRSTASYLAALFRPEDLADDYELANDIGISHEGMLDFGHDIDFLGDGAVGTPEPVTPPATDAQ
jgi:serine/threonine-protein kinase RsbW